VSVALTPPLPDLERGEKHGRKQSHVSYVARRLQSVCAALLRGGSITLCARSWSPYVRENRVYFCVFVCEVEMFVSLFLQMNKSDIKIQKHRWINKIKLYLEKIIASLSCIPAETINNLNFS
jgi:hypothetical protein